MCTQNYAPIRQHHYIIYKGVLRNTKKARDKYSLQRQQNHPLVATTNLWLLIISTFLLCDSLVEQRAATYKPRDNRRANTIRVVQRGAERVAGAETEAVTQRF